MAVAELSALRPRPVSPPSRSEPWPRRVVRGLCRALDTIQPPRWITAEELIAAAERKARATDWGTYSIREPLEVLLHSCRHDMELSPFGMRYLRRAMLDAAVQRLKIVQVMHRLGDVEALPIPKPLFVVGLPRTGTTLLYNLLCCDPNRRPLDISEGFQPYNPRWIGRPDFRRLKTRIGVNLLNWFLPELQPIHKINPTGPEECFALLHRTFVSATFFGLAPVSSYLRWLTHCPDDLLFAAYGFYRSQLKLLQWNEPPRPWVLKNPAHICGLRGLLHAFPDGCIVQTHRDLANVCPSWLSLLSVSRLLTVQDPSHFDVHADLAIYCEMLRAAINARSHAEDRFVDVHYRDLMHDPLGTVRRIYERFGLDFTPEHEQRARDWLAAHPRGKHGEHKYTLEQFGLTRDELDAKLAFYNERFGIDRE